MLKMGVGPSSLKTLGLWRAAKIAMEYHLGLTCDPIGGLFQTPYIERISIRTINTAKLALETDPKQVKVSLDEVINRM